MIDDFLQSEIDTGSFPSAVYAIGSTRGVEHEGALGDAVAVPLRVRASLDTIYDCASLTKPLITTTLILQAVAEGRISLDGSFEGFTYRELLTHTSGLEAWLPLYAYPDYLGAIRAYGHSYARGTRVVYSDLNFILLYYALQRLYGDYVSLANRRIMQPLGIASEAMFRPAVAMRPRIAAAEWSQRHEKKMCAERGIVFSRFREGLIWGETHDGNSYYNEGTAGNAGLFATARAVFRIAQAWVDGTLIPAGMVTEATRNYTTGLEENRGLGWQMRGDNLISGALSPRAFGHTGFTGTSVWIDPAADRIMVLLTNRVHPSAAPVAMQKIRGEFHQMAVT